MTKYSKGDKVRHEAYFNTFIIDRVWAIGTPETDDTVTEYVAYDELGDSWTLPEDRLTKI